MKIFISWSGPISKQVAQHLYNWLPLVLQYTEPYMSMEDIDVGTRWFASVGSELETSRFGLFCLTRSNLSSPWLHWEAGAISKVVDRSKVVPMLFHLQPSDLSGPLTQFQAATFEKDEVLRVLKSINNAADEEALDEARLPKIFTTWWEQLASNLASIPEDKQDDVTQNRSTFGLNSAAVLEELLVLARQQSVSSTSAFANISRQLIENTERLHMALTVAYRENVARIEFTNFLPDWHRFYKVWCNFFASPKVVDAGLRQSQEMTRVVDAMNRLRRSINVLSIRARRRAARDEARGKARREALERPLAETADKLLDEVADTLSEIMEDELLGKVDDEETTRNNPQI